VFSSFSQSAMFRHDPNVLEKLIKGIISKSRLGLVPDAPLEGPPNSCKTFVVAVSTQGAGAGPVRMRTYGTETADPFKARIWEAARATSAAATFFPEITINDERYGDGATGWNNPAAEALAEAHSIWPGRVIGTLVSIGTGLEAAIQLDAGNEGSEGFMHSMLQYISPSTANEVNIARYCVLSLLSCEKVHRQLSESEKVKPDVNYFRFNVQQGLYRIGLDEYDKLGAIVSLTTEYLTHGAEVARKKNVARLLWQPQLAS